MPKETNSASWKKVLGGLVETLTTQATNSIAELTRHSISQIAEEKNKMVANFKKMILSAGLMVIGVVFLLVGVATILSEYFKKDSLGYILTGLIVIVAGLWLGRKK